METEKRIKKVKTVYTEIINRLIKPSWEFPQGGKPEKTITKFFKVFEKKYGVISDERLVEFCAYTLHRLRDYEYLLTERGFSSCFGQTAIDKYETIFKGSKYHMNEWLKTRDLSTGQLVNMIADKSHHPLEKYMYMPSEENTKLRFHNTKSGYFLCQQSTLGWSPQSPTCQECTNTEMCQKNTEKKYPELYRIRKENEQRN